MTRFFFVSLCLILATICSLAQPSSAATEHPLSIGWATTDITPPRPVALVGQKAKRISQGVRDPLTATALALETRDATGESLEQAVLVSCDLCFIAGETQRKLREALVGKLGDCDPEKVFLNATHTHTGPQQVSGSFFGLYDVSGDEGVMTADEYGELLVGKLVEVVQEAWNGRKPGGVSWGLGQAVVGHNRRATYFDGTSVMYGKTDREEFDRLEGYEDHSVPLLFFWNTEKKLTGVLINLACPSQETEGLSVVSADFWHDIREELWKRYSKDLFVFPQCGAAGDISPHLMYRKEAERIMMERKGIERRQEIALRVADAVDETLPYSDDVIENSVEFAHEVAYLDLSGQGSAEPPFYKTDDPSGIEIHVIRIGDIAIASNPFEFYLDYGVRIQARSKAVLTFISQLSSMKCGYLPTQQAVEGGGYSADQYIVGPYGGKLLVDETVNRIDAMWE
jgi:hypothetical protein